MKKTLRITRSLILILAFCNTINILSQGYKIKLTIYGIQNKTVLLGHYFAKENFVVDDSVKLNSKGVGILKGNEDLPAGMYSIAAPPERLFDFFIGEDQEFSIKVDTSDYYLSKVTEGNTDDELFVDYQKLLAKKRKEAQKLQEELRQSDDEERQKEIKDKLGAINDEVVGHQKKLIEDNENSFFATFLKATMDIEIPDPPRDEYGNIIDSAFQYKYYRAHYFDNFDIGDPRLIRTPFYEKKFKTFFEKVLVQIPDTLIPAVDDALQKGKASEELYRYMLIQLFNLYAKSQIMGMDAVYVHIAENYYIPDATWSDSTFIAELKERVEKAKPNLIGKVSVNPQLVFVPKEHFIAAADDPDLKKNPYVGSFFNVHDVNAEFLAIIFWAADCGHCKKAVPDLYKLYEKEKEKEFQVIAIHQTGGEEGKVMWVDFVNKYKIYDWINAWNPYDYSYKVDFDVSTTNVIYLLDREKRIIAKRITPDQVEDIIKIRRRQQE